jgi:hypothetical protein
LVVDTGWCPDKVASIVGPEEAFGCLVWTALRGTERGVAAHANDVAKGIIVLGQFSCGRSESRWVGNAMLCLGCEALCRGAIEWAVVEADGLLRAIRIVGVDRHEPHWVSRFVVKPVATRRWMVPVTGHTWSMEKEIEDNSANVDSKPVAWRVLINATEAIKGVVEDLSELFSSVVRDVGSRTEIQHREDCVRGTRNGLVGIIHATEIRKAVIGVLMASRQEGGEAG